MPRLIAPPQKLDRRHQAAAPFVPDAILLMAIPADLWPVLDGV